VKASVAKGKEQKIQCHHKAAGGIGNWERIIDLIFEEILCDPGKLEAVCPKCHDAIHRPVQIDTLPDNRELT